MTPTLIKGGTLAATGENVDILKVDGVISILDTKYQIPNTKYQTIDATGHLLFPGLIDCHVHFRDPGFPNKATMQSEAIAARAGGITCVCDMPNTDPPTVTIAALADKVRRSKEVKECDICFYFGVTKAEHLVTLKELWSGSAEELQRLRAHCSGLKLYLDHSTGNQKIEEDLLDDVFAACAELNIPIIAHCEDPKMNEQAASANTSEHVSAHSDMRPAASEVRSIEMAIEKAQTHGAAFHVAHLSTAEGLERVREAKGKGLPITCEVSPHHLLLNIDDYEHLGTLGKMNPPLRTKEDNEALMQGLKDGTVDCIATDHAPHTLDEKHVTPPLSAPSGVPGVETALGLALKHLSPEIVYAAMYKNPNTIFRLGQEDLEEGSSADIVIVDPTEYEIHAADLHAKCGWTPFESVKARGKVVGVY